MYYEEKLINGIWCFRLSPNGTFRQMSIEKLSEKISELKDKVNYLKSEGKYEILSNDLKEVVLAEKENRIKRVESFYPAFMDNKEKCHMVWFSIS